jgi:hypothetical protein
MATCDVCGNDYDKAFTIQQQDRSGTFDSFECAIAAMAPECAHCGVTIIGHGVEDAQQLYCCANCARQKGQTDVADRVST